MNTLGDACLNESCNESSIITNSRRNICGNNKNNIPLLVKVDDQIQRNELDSLSSCTSNDVDDTIASAPLLMEMMYHQQQQQQQQQQQEEEPRYQNNQQCENDQERNYLLVSKNLHFRRRRRAQRRRSSVTDCSDRCSCTICYCSWCLHSTSSTLLVQQPRHRLCCIRQCLQRESIVSPVSLRNLNNSWYPSRIQPMIVIILILTILQLEGCCVSFVESEVNFKSNNKEFRNKQSHSMKYHGKEMRIKHEKINGNNNKVYRKLQSSMLNVGYRDKPFCFNDTMEEQIMDALFQADTTTSTTTSYNKKANQNENEDSLVLKNEIFQFHHSVPLKDIQETSWNKTYATHSIPFPKESKSMEKSIRKTSTSTRTINHKSKMKMKCKKTEKLLRYKTQRHASITNLEGVPPLLMNKIQHVSKITASTRNSKMMKKIKISKKKRYPQHPENDTVSCMTTPNEVIRGTEDSFHTKNQERIYSSQLVTNDADPKTIDVLKVQPAAPGEIVSLFLTDEKVINEVGHSKDSKLQNNNNGGSDRFRTSFDLFDDVRTTPWVRNFLRKNSCNKSGKIQLVPIPKEFCSDSFNLVLLPPVVEKIGQYYYKKLSNNDIAGSDRSKNESVRAIIDHQKYWIYKQALQLLIEDNPIMIIPDHLKSSGISRHGSKENGEKFDLNCDVPEYIEKAATVLYILLHQRYVLCPHGMDTIRQKLICKSMIRSGHSNLNASFHGIDPIFGRCPRVKCYGMPLLPIGSSDYYTIVDDNRDNKIYDRESVSTIVSNSHHQVKFYCGCCGEKYIDWDDPTIIDGSAWGTSFCHLFLLVHGFEIFHPWMHSQKKELHQSSLNKNLCSNDSYTAQPRIYGFQLHPNSRIHFATTIAN